VFNDKAMKQYLTSDAFKGVQGAVQHGTKIDRKLADYIAMGMKEWALSKGVTITHWFQPLTGATAENTMLLKHHMTVVIL
jgi:glutamine synthetase